MSAPSTRQCPVAYTLRVAGRLDARWVGWFDGFSITGEPDGTTTISGAITDQAQLHRLLTKIRDLGMTLVRVESTDLIPGREL